MKKWTPYWKMSLSLQFKNRTSGTKHTTGRSLLDNYKKVWSGWKQSRHGRNFRTSWLDSSMIILSEELVQNNQINVQYLKMRYGQYVGHNAICCKFVEINRIKVWKT